FHVTGVQTYALPISRSIVAMTRRLASGEDETGPRRFATVALSGGCFQNRILFEEVSRRLESHDFTVLSHAQVPANDGGLALGQRSEERRGGKGSGCG